MSQVEGGAAEGRVIGRYVLFDELASGGMATVHIGRLLGPVGFARTVAIKRLHAQFAKDPEFVSMFLDEARLAARIQHPNVVSTLDVVATAGELFLVMEFIRGESVATLVRLCAGAERKVPLPITIGVMAGVLYGLHAAHEARGDHGRALTIIHRDVSPQNVVVGTDGVARVLDFGVAKAAWRMHTTRDGSIKGKLRYMAPEQLEGGVIDHRVDIFSASIVLWELLTGRRLFAGEEPSVFVKRLMGGEVERPRQVDPELPEALDQIVMRGLAPRPEDRFATAREMAMALETAVAPATSREIGDWVERTAGERLANRAGRIAEIESTTSPPPTSSSLPPSVAAHAAAAEGVQRRAQMPTLTERTDPRAHLAESTDLSVTTPSAVRPPHRGRRSLLGVLGVLGVLGGVGLIVVWSTASPPRGDPSSAAYEAPRSSVETSPVAPVTPVSAAIAEVPEASASPPRPAPASAPVPRSSAPVRPAARSPGRPAKPVPSTKPAPCMKQRADGVVYFEPCP